MNKKVFLKDLVKQVPLLDTNAILVLKKSPKQARCSLTFSSVSQRASALTAMRATVA